MLTPLLRRFTRWNDRRDDAGAESAPVAGPPELEELLDTTRKTARAVARLTARFDSVESQLGAALVRLQAREALNWTPLMDALDGLDAAAEAISEGHIEGAGRGLAGISRRLESLLENAGFRRHAQRDVPVDGRLHRVVGVSAAEATQNGNVTRVVRAAITRDSDVVRVGEVIAAKHET